ncbi:MAG: transposase [bacterium]
MSRPLRIEYPGAVYHITSRGIDRNNIFNKDKDRQYFIQLLKDGADYFRVEVITYCLMSNHFHFLLRTEEANLSRFMQRLNGTYTQYFNYKYNRVGPLMQGRYKAILVGSDEYYLALSRYIHLNPIKIKNIEKKSKVEKEKILNSYIWSSYLGIIEPSYRSTHFKVEEVLEQLGGDSKPVRKEYQEYVEAGLNREVESPLKEVKYQLVIGPDKFVEEIKEKYIKGKDLASHPHVKGIEGGIEIDEIAKEVSKEFGIDKGEIIRKKSRYIEARNIMIELAYLANINIKSLTDIGRETGNISGSGVGYVHKRIQKKFKENVTFRNKFERIGKFLSILETP